MTEENKLPEKKITLPSSGLAEEILGAISNAGELPAQEAALKAGEKAGPAPQAQGRKPGGEQEGSLHLVTFFLNKEEYALDISQVQEIIRVNDWTRVPGAPVHVKGVINLRGRIIPVVDPKARMGLTESGLTRNGRIMVIEVADKVLGILVDSVSQVMRLPLAVVEDAPEEVTEAEKGYIKGVGKQDGRIIILLDLARLISREEKVFAAAG